MSYNSLDNGKNPTEGFLAEARQDIAGAGGTQRFLRTTGDFRYYHPIYDQIVGLFHLQGGDLRSTNGEPLRIVDTQYNVAPGFTQGNTITVGADHSNLIRTSAGGSIIWQSPLGPLRFDFAKAITKSEYDVTQFFRFSGGTTF